jgi:predicted DNA-binding protein (MmcQ/YjbR family)
MPDDAESTLAGLLQYALGLPGAWQDQPWENDTVAKVGKKIFVFFGTPDHAAISVKLPESNEQALAVRGAVPTGYGLGRGGWVTVPVAGRGRPQIGILRDWIEESYRAVAPKKLSAQLDR